MECANKNPMPLLRKGRRPYSRPAVQITQGWRDTLHLATGRPADRKVPNYGLVQLMPRSEYARIAHSSANALLSEKEIALRLPECLDRTHHSIAAVGGGLPGLGKRR